MQFPVLSVTLPTFLLALALVSDLHHAMTPGRNDTTFQIPVDSFLLDAPMAFLKNVWNAVMEVLTNMVLLWIEPIMDSKSLIDLSIGMLLMQRVGSNIQRYDPKAMLERVHTRDSASWESGDSLLSSGVLFGSPFAAVLLGIVLVLSCQANSREDVRRLAPIWIRLFLPRYRHGGGSSSAALMYLLLFLFGIESLLMVSILIFGCHAITFLEWLEEDLQILTYLVCAWLTTLLASSFVRYHLYYSIGD